MLLNLPVLVLPFLILSSFSFAAIITRITKNQPLNDGDILVSNLDPSTGFTMGFFSLGNATEDLRYLGIWYKQDGPQSGRSVIWVANLYRSVGDRKGKVTIADDGKMKLWSGNGSLIVWTEVTITGTRNTVGFLSESGDLVLSPVNSAIGDLKAAYWRSPEGPTNTFMPGRKVLIETLVGSSTNVPFRSWSSPEDPYPGAFTMGVDPQGAPQLVIWEKNQRRWRSGMLNEGGFNGLPSYTFNLSRGEDDGRMYLSYAPTKAGDRVRLRLSWDGKLEQLRWNDSWQVTARQPSGDCQGYGFCGKFGVCDELGSPKCRCMEGFQPEDSEEWNRENWSGGCQRIKPLGCGRGAGNHDDGDDDFRELRFGKLPDFANLRQGAADDSCRRLCLTDCQCNAYAEVNGIGSSCLLWTQELVDSIHHFNGSSNNVLFLRLANSRPGNNSINGRRSGGSSGLSGAVIAAIVVFSVVSLVSTLFLLCRILTLKRQASEIEVLIKNGGATSELIEENEIMNATDIPLLSFSFVELATDHFSPANMLGEGGFGPVYKGALSGGEEIAVKRLSRISGQGLEEFKNEINVIAKLQHRNLVRLLGYCVHEEDKMIVYEYMSNKSLDFFLFDPIKQADLDWGKRLMIIEGIARGLLYLHRDSRLRVIHRDLKASNVLLDMEMNPKISDFGMARIFAGNQNEAANTIRVVGTYGYMSPEYAMEGVFSVKSDVYSFGVLVLEIVSGRRNTSFRYSDHVSLIAYAWELWSQGRALELTDSSIRDTCSATDEQLLRRIQVGMLCVQGNPVERPTMAGVMSWLENDSLSLPVPRQPTYTERRRDLCPEGEDFVSNEVTVTTLVGR